MDFMDTTRSVMGKAKFFAMLAMIAAIIVLIGILRTDRVSLDAQTRGVHEERLKWSHNCNTVIMGDSRAQLGICPAELTKIIPGCDAKNFAFAGVASECSYFVFAEKILKTSEPRRIIYGITPRSMTHDALANNAFKEIIEEMEQRDNSIANINFKITTTGIFRPYDIKNINVPKFKKKKTTSSQAEKTPEIESEIMEDGWVGVKYFKPEPELTIPSYAKLFTDHHVLPELEDIFFEQVKKWTAQGIRVYCMRVPVSPKMYELENSTSEFNQDSFVKRVHDAGGVWLDFPMSYDTFDGSHLGAPAAIQFSRDLAMKIAQYEQQEN